MTCFVGGLLLYVCLCIFGKCSQLSYLSVVYRLFQSGSVTNRVGGPTDPHPRKGEKEKREKEKGYRGGPKNKTAATIRGGKLIY